MTTNIHDYSQAETIILSVDSVSTVVAGLPLIDQAPAQNTVPMSFDTGNIDPAWFDTPSFNLSEIAGTSVGVAMPPIPKSTVKVQAPSGSDIVALDLLVDREDILVIATQDSICFDVKPLTKPTSDRLLRSRQIRLALLPRVTLHSLTSLNNNVTVPAHLSAKLPTTSGGSLAAGDLWLITLDWVEGRFKAQAAGWHMTAVYGPFPINAGAAGPTDLMLLDGATAVFPVCQGNPDGVGTLPADSYFPSGSRQYVGNVAPTPATAYVTPFFWGMSYYSNVDKSLGRLHPLLTGSAATLSEGNARLTGVSSGNTLSGNPASRASGKWYFEIYLQSTAAFGNTAGLINGKTANVSGGIYTQGFDMGFYGSPYTSQNFTCPEPGGGAQLVTGILNVGDTFGIAYDADNLVTRIYLRGNLIRTIPTYPGCLPYLATGQGKSLTMRFHDSDFVYAPPAGFLAWGASQEDTYDRSPDRISVLPAGSPLLLSDWNRVIDAPNVGTTFHAARHALQRFKLWQGFGTPLGKWYWEVHLDDVRSLSDVRVGTAAVFNADGTAFWQNSLIIQINSANSQTIYRQEGSVGLTLALAVGDTISFLYDAAAQRMHVYHNGALVYTDNNRAGAQYPFVELRNNAAVKCVFHAEDFRLAIPAGYLPWAC